MTSPEPKIAHRRCLLLLIGMGLAAYGLLIIRPGIFGDDAQLLYAFHRFGLAGYGTALGYSRPCGLWVYGLLYPLLGDHPGLWQLAAVLLRILSACLFFDLLRRARESWRLPALWAAGLCLLYPGFSQQAHALQFSLHWCALSAGLASQILMLRAADTAGKQKSRLLSLAALLLAGLGIFSTEYFFGLEALRPLLLAVHQRDGHRLPPRESLQRWLPYGSILLIFLIWRLFVSEIPYPQPLLLDALVRDSAVALAGLLARAPQDLWKAGALAWANVFNIHNLNMPLWQYLAIGAALAAAMFFACPAEAADGNTNSQSAFFLCAGLLALLAGALPLWVSSTPLELSFPENRATLCLLAGAGLLAAGFFRLLPAWLGRLAAGLLIGFSAVFQFNIARDYQQAWQELGSFFGQLTRCAPALEPGTAVLYEEPFISSYPANALAALLNWTYDPQNRGEILSYDMLRVSERLGEGLPALELGLPIRHGSFSGSTSQVLAVALDEQGCLRILRPGGEYPAHIHPFLRQAMRISNPGSVIKNTAQPASPPAFLNFSSINDNCVCF